MENIFDVVVVILFCIFLYKSFCKKTKIKTIKAPTTKEIRKKNKHNRKIKKIKRKFKLPFIGKTQIIEYDKDPYNEYIESIWDEIKRK